MQFGFKEHSSTTKCTFALTETVNYFRKNKSNVYDDDDDNDDNFIAIYMYITRHTCNGMRFAPELLHSMLPTIQYFHPYST